jgi:hypothetical protein
MWYSSTIHKCLQIVLLLILSKLSPQQPINNLLIAGVQPGYEPMSSSSSSRIWPHMAYSDISKRVFDLWKMRYQTSNQVTTTNGHATIFTHAFHWRYYWHFLPKNIFKVCPTLKGATSHHRNPERSTSSSKWQFSSHHMFKTESSNFLTMR